MAWQGRRVIWSRGAARTLASLVQRDPTRAEAIRAQVRAYAARGNGDVRKLAGRRGEYRLRVGDWRVIFSFGTDPASDEPALFVLEVGDRRDIYRS